MQGLREFKGVTPYAGFFLLAGFALGGWLAFSFNSLLFFAIALAPLPFLFAAIKRKRGSLLIFLAALALGIGFGAFEIPPASSEGNYAGVVIEAKTNYFLYLSKGCRYYVYEKESTREVGDYLTIEGRCFLYECSEYEGKTSFKETLRQKGVRYQLSPREVKAQFTRPFRLHEKEQRFLASFSAEGADLLDALLFDHKDSSSALLQEASGLGCLYFLSLSGLLFGGVLRFLDWLFGLVLEDKKAHIVSVILATFFLPFSAHKPGIVRVYLVRAAHLGFEARKRKAPPHFFVLSAVGVFSLILQPYWLFNPGFLLGYGLSFALVLSREKLAVYPGKKKALMSSLYVLFFLLPLLAGKGALHLFSGLYSFLLMPLVYPFAFLGFASFLSVPFVPALNAYASFIARCLAFLGTIDVRIPLGHWTAIGVYFYYVFFALFYWARDWGFFDLERVLLFSLAGVLMISVIPLGNALREEVDFINVGQGDAILVLKGYTSVMIDTGGSLSFDLAEEVDIPYLRKKKIRHLDALIASHGDFDHIGAASSLRDHFKVNNYIDKATSFPLDVGDLHFTNYNVFGGTEENEESLVLSLELMGKKWLFTGDAPIAIEEKIIARFPQLDVDILKVGHHGSDTSSSLAFLKTITPELGVISVGKKNRYGHPSATTLARFAELGIPLRRSDVEGTISFQKYRIPFFDYRLGERAFLVPEFPRERKTNTLP